MSERPFMPKPGPPSGSGPDSGAGPGGSGQDSGPGPAPASGTGPAARPAVAPYGRPEDDALSVPGPAAPTPQPRWPGPPPEGPGLRPEEPGPQPAESGAAPGATPDTDDGSDEPAQTSPDQRLGGHQAPRAGRNLTGDAVVDRALDDLDALPGQPLDRHIEVGQQVHRTLQARLADIGRE